MSDTPVGEQQAQTPVPKLPVYKNANTFIHPKQQRPLLKLLNRMLKPKVRQHARIAKRPKKKHQVRFY